MRPISFIIIVLLCLSSIGAVVRTGGGGGSSSGSGTINSGTASRTAIYATTGTTLSSSSIMTDNGTNIGISSVNPTQKLDVIGTGKFDAVLINGGSVGTFYGPNGFKFDPNNATGSSLNPALVMLTTGNIGIGTNSANPGSPLQVTGNAFFSNLGGNEITYDLNGANYGSWYNSLTDSTVFYGATVSRNTSPTSPIFTLGTDSGNVGIGTAIPRSLFDVNGQAQMSGFKLATGASSGYVLTSNSLGVGTWQPSSGGGGGSGTVNSGTANFFAYYPASNTTVGANTILNIVGSNVGISTASPGQNLDVAGTVRATNFSGLGTSITGLPLTTGVTNILPVANGGTNANSASITAFNNITGYTASGSTGTTSTNLVFSTSPTITTPIITSIVPGADFTLSQNSVSSFTSFNSGAVVNTLVSKVGNVGIGTVNPAQPLDVNGTVIIRSSGNIGIGTTSPSAFLEIGNKAIQASSAGLVTQYNTIATVNQGVPSEVAVSNLTGQSAAIGATTLYAVPVTGYYRVSWSATITTAGTTSSLGGTSGLQVRYTSPTDSVVKTDNFTSPSISAGNTTGTSTSGVDVAYCKTGTNLQYLFGYSSTGTTMVYEIHIVVEAM